MSPRTLVCFALAFLLSSASLMAQELTEQEALRRFAVESPLVLSLKARVEEVRAGAQGRSLAPNPSVNYSREDAFGSKEDYLLIQQTLPLNGRLGFLRRAGTAAVNVQEQESAYHLLQMRSSFRLAFYELVLAQNRKQAIRQAIIELQEVVRILREREREGESALFDRLRAERELADIESEQVAAEASLAEARARLASALAPGTEPDLLNVKGSLQSETPLPGLPELVARALEVRADSKAKETQLEQFQFERRAAERQRIPDPLVGAGFKRVSVAGAADTGYQLSFTLPIPLFNRGQTEAAQARFAQERTQAERQSLRQRIATEVKAAYTSVQLRRRNASEYGRGLQEKGSELARIAQAAYQDGEQKILELLDAYRVKLQSQLRLLEFCGLAKQAEIELDRAVGEEVTP